MLAADVAASFKHRRKDRRFAGSVWLGTLSEPQKALCVCKAPFDSCNSYQMLNVPGSVGTCTPLYGLGQAAAQCHPLLRSGAFILCCSGSRVHFDAFAPSFIPELRAF